MYYFNPIDLQKCAAFMYVPFTLREDRTGFLRKATISSHGWSRKTSRAISMTSVFYSKKVPKMVKTGASIVYWIHIVQYPKKLEGSLMFLQKVSFENWRWKKKHRRGFLSKVEKAAIWIWSYILNLQHFHIFSYTFFSVRCFAYITKI